MHHQEKVLGATLALRRRLGAWGKYRNGRCLQGSLRLFAGHRSATYRPQSSSFSNGILNMNPKKELLWGLWVLRIILLLFVVIG